MFFSVIAKTCTSVFGNHEMSLRLFPLIAGIISLFLFYKLLKCCVSPKSIPLALGLFVLCDTAVYYSAELKPYSSDILIALALYIYYLRHDKTNLMVIRLLGVLGALCMWLSHTSIFVLGAFFVTQLTFNIKNKRWNLIYKHIKMYLFWILGFVLLYRISLSQMVNSQYILGTWRLAFMPSNAGFLASCNWIITSLINVFKNPLTLACPIFVFIIFLFGVYHAFKNDKERALLFFVPLLLVLCSAIFHKYPFQGRMLLFLVPVLIIFISEGVLFLSQKSGSYNQIVATLLVTFLLFQPIKTAFYSLYQPRAKSQNRQAILLINERIKEGDILLLNSSAQYPWWYYFG